MIHFGVLSTFTSLTGHRIGWKGHSLKMSHSNFWNKVHLCGCLPFLWTHLSWLFRGNVMLHDWYSANLFFLHIYKISRQKQYFSQCHLTISKHSNHRALQRTGFIKTEVKGRLVTAHLSESQGPSKAEVSLAVTSDGLKRARETMLRARAPSRKKSQLGSPRPFEPAWSMLALTPPPPSRAPPHPSHTLAASYSPFPMHRRWLACRSPREKGRSSHLD